jgi:hypothetical protein
VGAEVENETVRYTNRLATRATGNPFSLPGTWNRLSRAARATISLPVFDESRTRDELDGATSDA